MSYDIFYDKQFVKLDEKTFIPMVLVGSNNCTEITFSGKERRARNWSNFSYILDGAICGTIEQMLKIQEKTREEKIKQYPEEYKDANFGYYTSLSNGGRGCNMTYGQYIGIVKTGCKKSLTIEQLIEENVTINIHTYNSKDTIEILKKQGLEPISFSPKSTKEMLDFIKNVEPKYKGKREGYLYLRFNGMNESTPKWIRKKFFPKKKVEKEAVKTFIGYTVRIIKENCTYGYLYSFKGGSFRYSVHKDGGKQFLTKKEAEKLAEKIKKRRPHFEFEAVQVEYTYEKTFYVPKGKTVVLPVKEDEIKITDEQLINSLVVLPNGEEVSNIFIPENKCFLEPIAVALHDFIKGCEVTRKYEKMEQALRIFREKYPEEYYILLD